MAEDLNNVSAELIETLQRLNSSFRATGDALDGSTSVSNQNQRALAAEFEKLGLTLKGDNTLLSTHAERTRERIRLEQEVNEQLKASGKVRQEATNAEIEEYKLTQKRNILYESELASLGRVIDANGKITKTQIELEKAQRKSIDNIKKEEENVVQRAQAMNEFESAMKGMLQQGVMLVLNQAFDTFAAGVTGAYKAAIAYEDALLAGTRGMRVDAAATAAKMQEMAKVTAKLGSSLSSMGDSAMAAGVGMLFLGVTLGAPVVLLAGAFTALIGLFGKFAGLEKEQQAAMEERNAELVKKQAEINDKLADGFTKLGEATMAGSDGMTGLRDRLYSMTLAMTDLESYNKVLTENKQELVNLGGTMIQGVKSFSGVASELIKSSLGKTLEDMGIGVQEMMGHTIQFMAYQNKLGLKTTGDVAKATGEYIIELDRLAAITGATRKEQEEARETILKEQKVQAALMIARENNDTNEIKRIEAIIATSAILKAKGLGTEGTNFAINQVSKGLISDAQTARAAMFAGGKGGATDLLAGGERDPIKLAQALVNKMQGIEKPLLGTTLAAGTTPLGTDNLYALNNFTKSLAESQKEYEEAKKKDPNVGSFNDFLDAQRKVTDSLRQNQVDKERAQRLEQQQKETAILAGQMDTIAKAFQAPSDGMMGAAYKMWDAVRDFAVAVGEFMKNPLDNLKTAADNMKAGTKEFFTGKTRKQQDAEELAEIDSKIKIINAMLQNPDEAKKLAENNLKLAKKEYEEKDKAVKELKKAYDEEKDLAKKTIAEKKLAVATEAAGDAKKKRNLAEKALDSTETGIFGYTSFQRSADQSELKELEAKKAKLTKSSGSAGGRAEGGAGGGAGVKPYTFASDNEGGESAFNQIDSKLREAVIKAASEYYEQSGGQKLIINSSLRTAERQQRLWNESVKLGTPGKGPTGMTVARPGSSPHEQGRAVDIQNYSDPLALAALRNAGLRQTEGAKDPVHFQRAFNGGIFNGPKSGYPVELHGREAIVPLPNFGDTVSVENNSQSASKSSLPSVTGGDSSGNDFAMMMGNMFSMMENKLDDMIDKLDTGNNYSDKLVKAMV